MNYLLFGLRVLCVMKKCKREEQEQLYEGPVCLKSADLVLLAKLILDEIVIAYFLWEPKVYCRSPVNKPLGPILKHVRV
jgi:hypothetical protein